MKRPASVTAICVFFVLNTLFFGFFGVGLSQSFGALFFLATVGPAILFAAVAWGLWNLKRWAHIAAIVLSGLLIIVSLVGFFAPGGAGTYLGYALFLVLSVCALLALSSKDVKVAFD